MSKLLNVVLLLASFFDLHCASSEVLQPLKTSAAPSTVDSISEGVLSGSK